MRYNGFIEVAKIVSEYSYYNAAGVLIVHSAIAYSDAVTIKNSGLEFKVITITKLFLS